LLCFFLRQEKKSNSNKKIADFGGKNSEKQNKTLSDFVGKNTEKQHKRE